MENTDKKLSSIDGLMNPSSVNNNRQRVNQIKTVNLSNDGLMERFKNKVVTNDGRELLGEGDQNFTNIL
jgi:hypothetical protein